jgi:hypothetical protein
VVVSKGSGLCVLLFYRLNGIQRRFSRRDQSSSARNLVTGPIIRRPCRMARAA